MEDIVVVAGRVCTNPVLVYAGHLEGRDAGVEFTRMRRWPGDRGVKLGSVRFAQAQAPPV
jgi:hypothetical protein